MNSEGNTKYSLSGKLFVVEGSDGVAKSTIAEKVAEDLSKKGTDVLFLSFPAREPRSFGKLVYDLHHNGKSFGIDPLSPISLQILHTAAHIDCIEGQILPALSKNKTVILDHYWWSSVAYGMRTGIPRRFLNAIIGLERIAWGNTKPEKLFLIAPREYFRTELSDEQWTLVCSAYEMLVEEEKIHYTVNVIENCRPVSALVESITKSIWNGDSCESKRRAIGQGFLPILDSFETRAKRLRKDNWAPTKTTEVFNTYWRFAAERQAIFFKRLKGEKVPWTEDHILRNYKFTNAYRASDRVSQFLIRHVIYEGERDLNEVVFRTLLFKMFNKIETWQLLIEELGEISWRDYDFRVYDRILTKAQKDKRAIYSAAYIMPSGGSSFGHSLKHRNHLNLLKKMMDESLPVRISEAKSMQELFELLRAYPTIGDFLAYQYATDINYSTVTNFNEMSFVIPGPGAKDGLHKCFTDFGGLSEVDLIKLMADRQEDEFARLGLQFQNLWGRPLQLIDCQNLFCEVDKYSRIAHPEIKGVTGRNRIKQKFRPSPDQLNYFYPPKWHINEVMQEAIASK